MTAVNMVSVAFYYFFYLYICIYIFLHNGEFEIGIDHFVTSVFITKVDSAHFRMMVLSGGPL